jgi:hypothetical protein
LASIHPGVGLPLPAWVPNAPSAIEARIETRDGLNGVVQPYPHVLAHRGYGSFHAISGHYFQKVAM